MVERVICPSQLSTDINTVTAEFTNGSTFKIAYHFSPINQPGAKLRLGSFDMSVDYWINGYEDNVLQYDKPNLTNDKCIVDDQHALIKFIFRDYTLNTGKLMAKFTFVIPDPELGYVKDTFEGYTGIVIV